MFVKTLLKYGVAAAAGAIATTMLSADTKKAGTEFAGGVAKDIKAKAKKVGAATKAWWVENVDPGPKPPADTKAPPSSPPASA